MKNCVTGFRTRVAGLMVAVLLLGGLFCHNAMALGPEEHGTLVLVVVKGTLLPEITNEVERLRTDLTNEGYSSKIVPFTNNSAQVLWELLNSEYNGANQAMDGVILIGFLPTATGLSGNETTDCAFMNMETFRLNSPSSFNIWVSRIWATDLYGGSMPGGEVNLIKRYLQANHDYRTGVHRLPHTVYYCDVAYPESEPWNYPNDGTNALIVWPERVWAGGQLNAANRSGGELMDETGHGSPNSYGNYEVSTETLYNTLVQVRFSLLSSCESGCIGGVANQQLFSRGGGNIFTLGASETTYDGAFALLNDPPFLTRLAGGEAWGSAMVNGFYPFADYYRAIFYGDLSLPAKAAPPNQIPLISGLTAGQTSGVAPLSVVLTAAASDPDGTVTNCEWFVDGFWPGTHFPAMSGANLTCITNTYTIPHRFLPRFEVTDNYKARASTNLTVTVAPEPGKALRINCGRNLSYYTPAEDYSDASSNLWLHDQVAVSGTWGYSGGGEGYVNSPVGGTTEDRLYQRFRSGPAFSYQVPLPNGAYWVKLGFADMQSSQAGQRVADVCAGGSLWFSGLDVFAKSGAKTARTETVYVDVTNSVLGISLARNAASSNDVFLNCLEILPYAGGNRPPLAQSLEVYTPSNTPVAVVLQAPDLDGDIPVFSVLAQPQHGTLSGTPPDIYYSPASGYVGADAFSFRAADGSSTGNIGVISIRVTGLAGQWALNEGSGSTAVDSSSLHNDITLTNAVAWTAGKKGLALSFDGSNDCGTASSGPYSNVTDNFTMMLWADPQSARSSTSQGTNGWTGSSGQRYAVLPTEGVAAYGAGHTGAGISIGTNGVSVFEFAPGYLPSLLVQNSSITNWTHVAVVYENRTPRLYLNGILVKTGLTSSRIVHPGASLGGSSYGWYSGRIDDVRIYNYSMTAEEVADCVFDDQPPFITSSLIASAIIGQSFSYRITATGLDPVTFSVRGLPAGLSFDGTNRICGIPAALCTSNVTLTASNALGAVTNVLVLSVTIPNEAPVVAVAPAASPNPVTGTGAALSVLGADSFGEANLTYTWATAGAAPAAVTFSANGNNAAKNTAATFAKAGSYNLQIVIQDAGGLSVTGTVPVVVNQVLSAVNVLPVSASVIAGQTKQYSATGLDQFGAVMSPQPLFGWSVSGGSISASGLFTAGAEEGGPYTVTASNGAVNGTANVLVTGIGGASLWDGTVNDWHTSHWTNTMGGALFAPSSAPGAVYSVNSGVARVSSTVYSGAVVRVLPGGTLSIAANGTATGMVNFAGGTVSNAAGQSLSLTASNGSAVVSGSTSTLMISGGALTLKSALSGNGTLVKKGSGDLIVDAASQSFTGALNIAEGRLKMDSAARATNLLNAVVNISTGAQLLIYANIDPNFNCLTLNGGAINTIASARSLLGSLTVAGSSVVDGSQQFGLACTVKGAGDLVMTNGTSFRIMTGYEGGSYSGAVRFAGSGSFDLYQTNATIGGLSGINGSGTVTCTFSSGTGVRVLTLQPPQGVTNIYNGQVKESAANKQLALTMNGPGVQVLSGICSNTALTTVNGGRLVVDGVMVAATNGVVVNAGGTLGGAGTVNRAVSVNAGGVLSPGDCGLGVLTVSNLTLAAGSTTLFDLGTAGASDAVAVNGTLALGGAVSVTAVPGFGAGTYELFACSGSISTSGAAVLMPAGYSGALQVSGGKVRLAVSVSGVADADLDGLPDAWEVANFGSATNVNGGPQDDFDHDGMCNLAEYIAGTSPTNAESALRFEVPVVQGGTNLVLQWPSVGGRFYRLQSSTNLLTGFDGVVISNIPATPALNTQTVTVDQTTIRYYRVTVE